MLTGMFYFSDGRMYKIASAAHVKHQQQFQPGVYYAALALNFLQNLKKTTIFQSGYWQLSSQNNTEKQHQLN